MFNIYQHFSKISFLSQNNHLFFIFGLFSEIILVTDFDFDFHFKNFSRGWFFVILLFIKVFE